MLVFMFLQRVNDYVSAVIWAQIIIIYKGYFKVWYCLDHFHFLINGKRWHLLYICIVLLCVACVKVCLKALFSISSLIFSFYVWLVFEIFQNLRLLCRWNASYGTSDVTARVIYTCHCVWCCFWFWKFLEETISRNFLTNLGSISLMAEHDFPWTDIWRHVDTIY